MKPLNEVDKKKARKSFAGIYALSLIAALLISYFLFSSPVKILKDNARTYSVFKVQHDALMNKLETISQKTSQFLQKGTTVNYPNAADDSTGNRYKKEIEELIHYLKSYSAKETSPQVKEDLNHYLSAYNAVLYYFNDRDTLQKEEENSERVIPEVTMNNGNNNESAVISQLRAEIKTLNAEKLKLNNENKRLLATTPGNNDDGINKILQSKLAETEREREMYKNQANGKAEELRSKDEAIKVLRKEKADLIAECDKKAPATVVNNEQNSRLYQAVDKAIRKSKHSKKEVLMDFTSILRSVENTYSQRSLLDKKVSEINKLMIGDF